MPLAKIQKEAMNVPVIVATMGMASHVQVSLQLSIELDQCSHFAMHTFTDIDECSTESVCDENAECLDTPGSYTCTCHSGYTGDGDTCLDIDECLSDPCDENAVCTNNNGSFSCQCDYGFIGYGYIFCLGKIYSHIFVSL